MGVYERGDVWHINSSLVEKKPNGKRRKEKERQMGELKPKVKEVEGGKFISGWVKFGVTIVGLSEEGSPVDGEPQDVDWENCSLVRLRCNTCWTVFDIEPQAPREEGRGIPLCPNGCNFILLEQWVKEQERKG
jgi:hypothetical protein